MLLTLNLATASSGLCLVKDCYVRLRACRSQIWLWLVFKGGLRFLVVVVYFWLSQLGVIDRIWFWHLTTQVLEF